MQPFNVTVQNRGAGNVITVEDKAAQKTVSYSLADNSQASHLDFHQWLAQHHGTRLPANRQQETSPDTDVPHDILLSENMEDILYGYGDPHMMRVQDAQSETGWSYYLTATSIDAPNSFPILHSTDMKDWSLRGFAMPEGRKPLWVKDGENSDFWAPELHEVAGEFHLPYVARRKEDGMLCVGVVKSDRPDGDYYGPDEPLLTGGVIDPHIFVDDDGTAYLYWKEDNNDVWPSLIVSLVEEKPELIPALFPEEKDRRTAAFAAASWAWTKTLEPMEKFQMLQPLIESVVDDYLPFKKRLADAADQGGAQADTMAKALDAMRTPFLMQEYDPATQTLCGAPQLILENDRDWEGHVIEGMCMMRSDEGYGMFYAANSFDNSKYGIGYAKADTVRGPFKKNDGPFLQSSAALKAPGHPSSVLGLDGKRKLIVHYFPGEGGYKAFRGVASVDIDLTGGSARLDHSRRAPKPNA